MKREGEEGGIYREWEKSGNKKQKSKKNKSKKKVEKVKSEPNFNIHSGHKNVKKSSKNKKIVS